MGGLLIPVASKGKDTMIEAWHDRARQWMGQDRLVVARIFLHLRGQEVAPLLGVLNQAGREARAAEGDLRVLGEGLLGLIQALLQHQTYWQSAANEGDVFWDEGEASQYFNELFLDSAQRYLSDPGDGVEAEDAPLSLPASTNWVVMITVAVAGEVPALETDLSSLPALTESLRSLAQLVDQGRLRAIQVHFSPAQLGDELTDDQLLQQFPELLPL